MDAWFNGNSHVLELRLRDYDREPVEGATVSATITDAQGSVVAGVSWPVSLTHQGSGVYRTTLPALTLAVDGVYEVRVEADFAGVSGARYIPLLVKVPY